MITIINATVDGQIIQTPHPWVVGYPLSQKNSTFWFRIFVPDLRVWFFSSIQRSEPNQNNNIVIGVAGGLLDYKGLNNSSIYGMDSYSYEDSDLVWQRLI